MSPNYPINLRTKNQYCPKAPTIDERFATTFVDSWFNRVDDSRRSSRNQPSSRGPRKSRDSRRSYKVHEWSSIHGKLSDKPTVS